MSKVNTSQLDLFDINNFHFWRKLFKSLLIIYQYTK